VNYAKTTVYSFADRRISLAIPDFLSGFAPIFLVKHEPKDEKN